MKKTLLFTLIFVGISLFVNAQAFWLEQASGFTTPSRGIFYIDVVDQDVAWATAYDGSGGGATINEFTRTIDGGNTWIPGQVLGGTTYGLGNICAISADIAYVAVYNGVGNQDNTCGVYKTTNGGATWTQLPGALQGSASFANNAYFWNENDGMCHGDVKDGYFEIYWTDNGGTTWNRVPQTDINGTVASGEGGWTGVIEAVGDSTIMFGTNKSKIYISNDRGRHWFAKATGVATTGTTAGINEIAFVDEMHGLVAHANTTNLLQLAETSDGGQTWTLITYTGNAFSNSLCAVKGSPNTYLTTGAATGKVGITYSFDGGHTWNDFIDYMASQYLAIDMINDSVGWVGAFNTDATDGGMWKWNPIYTLAEPVADFVADETAIPFGGQVNFTNLSLGNPTNFTWTFEGGAPPSSNIQTPPAVTYNLPGSYDVTLVVTNIFGTNTMTKPDYIYVGGVGINETNNASVKTYPNPVRGQLNIEATSRIKEVQLYNLMGQVVLHQFIDNQTTTINVADLKSGIYNLKLNMEEGTINKKIVVN